jgi:hypothetical protein
VRQAGGHIPTSNVTHHHAAVREQREVGEGSVLDPTGKLGHDPTGGTSDTHRQLCNAVELHFGSGTEVRPTTADGCAGRTFHVGAGRLVAEREEGRGFLPARPQ